MNEFAKLPGVGQKTALRLVLHLLKQTPEQVQEFGSAMVRMRNEIRYCRQCHNISDAELCSICRTRAATKPSYAWWRTSAT